MYQGKGPGRPRKDPEDVRNKSISMRVSQKERERILSAAKEKGLSITDYFIRLMKEKGEESDIR